MDDFEEQSSQYAEYKVKQNLIVQGIMDAENMTLEDEKSLGIQNELIKSYNVKDIAALLPSTDGSSPSTPCVSPAVTFSSTVALSMIKSSTRSSPIDSSAE